MEAVTAFRALALLGRYLWAIRFTTMLLICLRHERYLTWRRR